MSTHTPATWGTRLGFILASAGSAVGLGAIWKFPYMAGTNADGGRGAAARRIRNGPSRPPRCGGKP